MESENLPHLKIFDRNIELDKIVEVAEVIFKGGRNCELHVLGIQRGKIKEELNLVHALNYDVVSSKIYDPGHLRNAMLEEVISYKVIRKV